jgi:hypothetical protein
VRRLPVECDPYEKIEINGVTLRILDLHPPEAAMYGYGHWLGHGEEWRQVIPGAYPYRQDTCRRADGLFPGTWLFGGTVLVCTGCGLDVT